MIPRLTRDELDREYSPSSCARRPDRTLRRYRTLSDSAREQLSCVENLRYGTDPAEVLHAFPAPNRDAAVHVFVHGGHWQESGPDDACFAAPAFVRAGVGFVALGYGLAPERTLEQMVCSVRDGLRWVTDHAGDLHGDPRRVFASGSSAGAHLLAMAMTDAHTAPRLAGVTLLSGVYDLEPIRHSYVNDVLRMSARTAQLNSPVRRLPLATPRVLVARGAHETSEYARQHVLLVDALARSGQPCADLVAHGRDHFDLPLDLGETSTPLGRAVGRQMADLTAR